MKSTKRYLSVVLAIMLFMSMFAGTAFAVDPTIIKISEVAFSAASTEIEVDPETEGAPSINMARFFVDPKYTLPAERPEAYLLENVLWTISDPSFGSMAMQSYGIEVENETTGERYFGDVNVPEIRLTKKLGTFSVTASNQDGTIKKAFSITVKKGADPDKNPVKEIKFTQSEYFVKLNTWPLCTLGEFVYEVVYEKPYDPYQEGYSTKWTVADTSILAINEFDGTVEPKKVGSTNVTLTVTSMVSKTEVSATIKVTVIDNPVTALSFSPADIKMEVGAEFDAWDDTEKTVTPAGVAISRNNIKFQSTDPTVARVNGTSVKALSFGEAQIIGTYFNPIAKTYVTCAPIRITVTETPATSITFSAKSVKLVKGDDLDLKSYITITPDADNCSYNVNDVEWSSSNIAVAQVGDGWVSAEGVGKAMITAKIYNKLSKKAVTGTIDVEVVDKYVPIESANFTQATFTLKGIDSELNLAQYLQFNPSGENFFWDDIDFAWTTDNYEVAAVGKHTGEVIANGIGEATITVTITNKHSETAPVTASTKIKVEPRDPVTKIEAKPASFKLAKGDSMLWNGWNYLVWEPFDAYLRVALSSSDDEVAQLFSEGNGWSIKGGKPGVATITVEAIDDYNKVTASTEFTVEVIDKVPLKSISFKKDGYTLTMPKTKNLLYQVKLNPLYATTSNLEMVWESSDMAVATVEQDGTVTGKKVGSTTITLTLFDSDGAVVAKASTVVKVDSIPVKKVAVSQEQVRLYFTATGNEDYQTGQSVEVKWQPSNAYVNRIEWETSNASVAIVNRVSSKGSSINPYGDILATGVGTATVTAHVFSMDADGNEIEVSQKIEVLVSDKSIDLKLNVSKKTMYLKKGEEVTFQMEAFDNETGDPANVKWSSSKPSVAKVDSHGVVTALKAGEAVISAVTKDGNKTTATAKFTVKKNKITKITVQKKLTMTVGASKKLNIKLKPSNLFSDELKITSSKPDVVSVDENGILTALKAGKATITVKAVVGGVKAKISVTVKE